MSTEEGAQSRSSRGVSRSLMVIIVVLLFVCLGFGAYSFHAWRSAVAANPVTTQNDITKAVNDIAVTPDEAPQIATIKDSSKLTSGALAGVTKNGDILLIYNKASKIIVYRPSLHKIVDMLSVEAPASTTSTTKLK